MGRLAMGVVSEGKPGSAVGADPRYGAYGDGALVAQDLPG